MRFLIQFVAGYVGAAVSIALVFGVAVAWVMYFDAKYHDNLGDGVIDGYIAILLLILVGGFIGTRFGALWGGKLYDRLRNKLLSET